MKCLQFGNDPVIVNFSSMNESLGRLGYLMPNLPMDMNGFFDENQYTLAILSNEQSFDQLMSIMIPLYEGRDVFICITNDSLNQYLNGMNDLLMGFIQNRYGYNSAIINDEEDFFSFYRPDFKFTTQGIMNLDVDRKQWAQMKEAERIKQGGKPYYEV